MNLLKYEPWLLQPVFKLVILLVLINVINAGCCNEEVQNLSELFNNKFFVFLHMTQCN